MTTIGPLFTLLAISCFFYYPDNEGYVSKSISIYVNNFADADSGLSTKVLSANNKMKIAVGDDTTVEDRVIDRVYNLPEVRAKDSFIDSITKHKNGISLIIFKYPTKINPYYWVQAGYDNKLRFEPYYNFYVYKENLEVKFYDTITGDILTLEQWRNKIRK